ncbi:MAG: TIGR03067 domain-containing protein [Isosphaeraceae bacterium]
MPTKTWAPIALLACVAAVAPAPARGEDPKGKTKTDLDRLQGQWTFKVGGEGGLEVTATFKGNKVNAAVKTGDGQELELEGEVVLNESARPHKTIDWVKFKNPNGDDIGDNPGIYAFDDDDTLKVCNGGPGNERPSEFKEGDGGPPNLLTLKRVGGKKAEPDSNTVVPEKKADKPSAELKGDLAKFQGTWTGEAGPERNIPISVEVKGTDVTISLTTPDGDERSMKGELRLDESAKPHKAITWHHFVRPDGSEAPENLGIYAFEGDDTLKVCSGGPGNERPTEFKAGEGGPPNLIVLKRKPAAK